MLPQLFYTTERNGCITAALAKIVDYFFFRVDNTTVDNVISYISRRFILGIIVHGSGVKRYFGLNITQYGN